MPAEWKLAEAPGGRTIGVRIALGVPCNDVSSVDVTETQETVTVDASVRVARGGRDDSFQTEAKRLHLPRPAAMNDLRSRGTTLGGLVCHSDAGSQFT